MPGDFMDTRRLNRRIFIKNTFATCLSLSILGTGKIRAENEITKPVRLGFVGVGSRGSSLLKVALNLKGVEIPAVCDIIESRVEKAQAAVKEATGLVPAGYSKGPENYLDLCQREDLDAVITATPWELHTPIAVAAMEAGKYAAPEVPAAVTLEECWQLVETSEKTGMPCMMLENSCYLRNFMAVMVMAHKGLFGELTHAQANYDHNVMSSKVGTDGELLWRGRQAIYRNGNLYPTHRIGPVSWWMDINRGDRLTYLVSMSSKSMGMNHFISERFGSDHPNAKIRYALGDVNTSLIRTELGRTITLGFDTQSPRPKDRVGRLQGTKGIYQENVNGIYIEGMSPENHLWEDAEKYCRKYDHPIWRKLGKQATEHSHGGADFMSMHQFVSAVRAGVQTPVDVYDSATWSAISPLTEKSVANKSAAVDVPDFTRGRWRLTRPVNFIDV